MNLISFKDYIQKVNEKSLPIGRDFSFAGWILENEQNHPDIRPTIKAMSDAVALEKAELVMSLVKQKLFTHFPIWRPFWNKMPPIASFGAGDAGPDGIGTMSTSGTAIFYDPRFVLISYEVAKREMFPDGNIPNPMVAVREGRRHPMDYSLFVMIHEILHCSLKHHLRRPTPSTELSPMQVARLWNLAADYEINHKLLDDPKSGLYEFYPGGVRADEGYFSVPADEVEFFTTASAERIFKRLLLNLEEEAAKKKEQQQEDEGDEGEDGDENQEGNDGQNGDGEGGGDGDGESDNDQPLKVGDVIYDRETGEYGVVSNIDGDNLDYEPISEEEAKQRIN
jgi:hypothetical protein